jgi:23S rRNA pseudouridine2605 synthase
MRLNKYVAQATGLSRRTADTAIDNGRVAVNGAIATTGQQVQENDSVMLDGAPITIASVVTLLLNKPVGYVCSRNGQGSQTVYDLLPSTYHQLKPVGRLDKDSSGLLLLTNDGELANQLTHPRYHKTKLYEVTLATPLAPLHQQMINDHGIQLDDGRSQLQLTKLSDDATTWQIQMHEGRNRQIRRTFAALGYTVTALHRTQFGQYALSDIPTGSWLEVTAHKN